MIPTSFKFGFTQLFGHPPTAILNLCGSTMSLDVVEKAILFFRDHGNKGERFAETIERIGFENVEKELIG